LAHFVIGAKRITTTFSFVGDCDIFNGVSICILGHMNVDIFVHDKILAGEASFVKLEFAQLLSLLQLVHVINVPRISSMQQVVRG